MPEISIRNFSCIQSASFTLQRLNIIIGPQGSGKSVTTKLVYFFAEIPQSAVRHAEDGLNFSEYKKILQKDFSIWFPPSAWGGERFLINYTDNNFSIRIMRRQSGGNPTDDVTIKFSKEFEDCYDFSLNLFKETRAATIVKVESPDRTFARDALEISWRTRDEVWKKYRLNLSETLISDQTFIPAGRAFFTSIGRLVAGIEHAGSLDPATLKFAKMFAGWRDQLESYRTHLIASDDHQKLRDRVMQELFGGTVQSKRDSEFIEMLDGRKVPFSSLSSGQQELLPIWYFLDNIMLMDAFYASRPKRISRERESQIVYIEEPEAHLFPEAQSLLVDVMVEILLGGSKGRSLIVTTHSPYIMARLNVLLKAGQISRRRRKNKELGEIVDRAKWLQQSDVAALSIEDGKLRSIMDETEGLIDAGFLDAISNITSEKFLALLELEASI